MTNTEQFVAALQEAVEQIDAMHRFADHDIKRFVDVELGKYGCYRFEIHRISKREFGKL